MDLSRNNHQSGQNQIVLIHRHHFHQNLQHFEFLHRRLMDHHLLLLTDILLLHQHHYIRHHRRHQP